MSKILELLEYERIFKVNIADDKKSIEIFEMCDEHFGQVLTKKELEMLIDDLSEIKDSLEVD